MSNAGWKPHHGSDGQLIRVAADDKTIGRLQVEINRIAGHYSFTRQTMMAAIRRLTGLSGDDHLDLILEERVSLIHLMSTLGSLTHMEVSNRRDRMSPYYYGRLLDHLGFLAEVPYPTTFTPALVLELRALPNWWAFAAYHLRLVSDATHRSPLANRLATSTHPTVGLAVFQSSNPFGRSSDTIGDKSCCPRHRP